MIVRLNQRCQILGVVQSCWRELNINCVKRYSTHSSSSTADLVEKARTKLSSLGSGKVLLEKDEVAGIATITLDHEEKKNAISGSMMVQLADIAQDLSGWSQGRGVILQAKGDYFCSGGDLTTVKAISNPDDGLLMSTLMHDTLTKIYTSPYITLCLVHGKAIGGGAELTSVADFRLFTETGEIAFVQSRMGVVTGWGGGTRLVKLLGATRALELLSTGRKLDSQGALSFGYANGIVQSEDRLKEAKSWLLKRISHDPEIVQAMKRIVVGARDLSLEDSLYNERITFSPLWGGPANVRALKGNLKHK